MSIAGFEGLKLPDLSIRAGLETLATRNTLVDEDPCSGRSFAEIPIASATDIDAIVDASWKAFREASWRDLAALQPVYEIERMTMVDLFPQTFHLETIVRLRLK